MSVGWVGEVGGDIGRGDLVIESHRQSTLGEIGGEMDPEIWESMDSIK